MAKKSGNKGKAKASFKLPKGGTVPMHTPEMDKMKKKMMGKAKSGGGCM